MRGSAADRGSDEGGIINSQTSTCPPLVTMVCFEGASIPLRDKCNYLYNSDTERVIW